MIQIIIIIISFVIPCLKTNQIDKKKRASFLKKYANTLLESETTTRT